MESMRTILYVILCGLASLWVTQANSMSFLSTAMQSKGSKAGYMNSRGILEQLYRGNSSEALNLANKLVEQEPNAPLSYLIRARVLRENLSEQDDDKKLIKRSAGPIYNDIEKAIELSKKKISSHPEEMHNFFFRGWAWMFKAQLDALGGSYWSAGRSAKKGKKDIDKFLEANPGDPDAQGILGTFLYFADTLPTIIKFIKTLFLIPGGDRERGLDMLSYASEHPGLLSVDHKIILAATYTLFEGRFEEGIKGFTELLSIYPNYLRLLEPLGLVATFSPREIRHFQAIENHAIGNQGTLPASNADWETIQRLRYHRSYSYIFFNSPWEAKKEFQRIIGDNPQRPDWLVPLSLVNLGVICANLGENSTARESFNRILAESRMKRFHDVARTMLKNLDVPRGKLDSSASSLSHAIYDDRREEAGRILLDYKRRYGETIHYFFYEGETKLLDGKLDAAKEAYNHAIELEVPEVEQVYQMFAASRLAEINGLEGDYRSAEKLLDKALEFYHKEFLIDLLLKGRKKFYARLAENKIPSPKNLMLSGLISAPLSSILDK